MQKHKESFQKAKSPLVLRKSVWVMVSSILFSCGLLLIISRHHPTQVPSTNASVEEGQTVREVSGTPTKPPSAYRAPVEPVLAETGPRPTMFQESQAIAKELNSARGKLAELSGDYGDGNADVQEQRKAVESLERSAITPGETLELARARAELSRLQVRFGPGNADLQSQIRFVESLEQSTAANEPTDLAQAKAQLAKLRVNYGDQNSEVQSQLKRVAELQR